MENIRFETGMPLFIELPDRISIDSHVIGYEFKRYIIVKLNDTGDKTRICDKTACSVKLIQEGSIYTFNTEALAVLAYPSPLVFLKYPLNMEVVHLRRDKRYKVNMPAVFQNNTQNVILRQVALADISQQGCRISLPDGEKHPELRVGDICKVSFIVMYKYFEAICIIKNVGEGADAANIGLEFTEIKEICKELLGGMINILEAQGS
jgi:c-di-GMP-binding flagellar brake protein YcgR